MMKLLTALAAFALVAAACGDSDGSQSDTSDDGTVVAGLCTVDNPDCDDVSVTPDDAANDTGDTSDGDDSVTAVGGMVVGDGLTISEALATDAVGVLAVQGTLFDDGTGVRLCEALAESFPPQCGGVHIFLDGFGFDQIDQLPAMEDIVVSTEQGVTWTEGSITLFGELDGDRFTVTTNSI